MNRLITLIIGMAIGTALTIAIYHYVSILSLPLYQWLIIASLYILLLTLLIIIVMKKEDGNEYENKSKRVWKYSPAIAVLTGFLLTFYTLLSNMQSGTSTPSLASISTAVVVGLLSTLTTFIGISVWVFVEDISKLRGMMEREYNNVINAFKHEAWNQMTRINSLTDSLKFIAALIKIRKDKPSNKREEAEKEMLQKAVGCLYMNTAAWSAKLVGNENELHRMVWASVMATYFREETYDIHKQSVATNIRNYTYIIIDILRSLCKELDRDMNLYLHYYASCNITPETFLWGGKEANYAEHKERERYNAEFYRSVWQINNAIKRERGSRAVFLRLFNKIEDDKGGRYVCPAFDKNDRIFKFEKSVNFDEALRGAKTIITETITSLRDKVTATEKEATINRFNELILDQYFVKNTNNNTLQIKNGLVLDNLWDKITDFHQIDVDLSASNDKHEGDAGYLYYLFITLWHIQLCSDKKLSSMEPKDVIGLFGENRRIDTKDADDYLLIGLSEERTCVKVDKRDKQDKEKKWLKGKWFLIKAALDNPEKSKTTLLTVYSCADTSGIEAIQNTMIEWSNSWSEARSL